MTTALITGASGGIGKTFAQELASRKNNLVLVARSLEKLNLLAKQLQEQYNIQVDVIASDLTQPGAAGEILNTVKEKGLTIDLLINNAGFGDYGDFSDRNSTRQMEMIQLNIVALVDLTHKFLPLMRERRQGSIINIASICCFFKPHPLYPISFT
ncbi:MAG: SDR family NAD(P)-dependent oxidoreductase, partial [Calothrix sp. SM1_7_51]|nr:SDR family NAD(P)-dependent oxidoreductase [Calothrix sp. SM1_7_51]